MAQLIKVVGICKGALLLPLIFAFGVYADPSTPEDRAALFDYILKATMERTAFSPTKPIDIGEALGAGEGITMAEFVRNRMLEYRQEMIDADTDVKLEHVLIKLNAARWDSHLGLGQVTGGLPFERSTPNLHAPIRFLPDFSNRDNIFLFVSDLPKNPEQVPGRTPELGDKLVGVNGVPAEEYLERIGRFVGYSSHRMHWWLLAIRHINTRHRNWPDELYDDRRVTYELETRAGERYQLELPYLSRKEHNAIRFGNHDDPRYPGFEKVFARTSFNLFVSRPKKILLFQGHRFDPKSLPDDIAAAMDFARENGGIDEYAVIYDLTRSFGGDLEEWTLQRLQPKPFKIMFGNLRISDITPAIAKDLRERVIANLAENDKPAPAVSAKSIDMQNDGSYLLDWLDNDLARAIREGQAYSSNVQFKNQFLSTSSDGFLYPAKEHFKGPMVLLTSPFSCSGADQFAAMFIENNLGLSVGMPEGGCSNTWEWTETLKFPISGKPVVNFSWTVGHSIGPASQIVEGNSARPKVELPLTRDNFLNYYEILLNHADRYIERVRATGASEPTRFERITHSRVN